MSTAQNCATHTSKLFYTQARAEMTDCQPDSPSELVNDAKHSPNNGHIVRDNEDRPQKKSRKSRKKSESAKKAAKRIEDLDRSLSISLEELLQGVNSSKSPQSPSDGTIDFSSPVTTPDCSLDAKNNSKLSPDVTKTPLSPQGDELVGVTPQENDPKSTPRCSKPSLVSSHAETYETLNNSEPKQQKGPEIIKNLESTYCDLIISESPEIEASISKGFLSSQSKVGVIHGTAVNEADTNASNKQYMPQGKSNADLSITVDEIPEDDGKLVKRNPRNKRRHDITAPRTNIEIERLTVDSFAHGFNSDSGSDLSPTSVEVTSILQNFSENPNMKSCYDDELSPDAATDPPPNHNASQAITRSTDYSVTPEYCKELSSLTLESSDNAVTDDGKFKLSRPRCAKEVPQEVLNSGIVTFPGCYDNDRRPVIFIHCDVIQSCVKIGKAQLARLMLYFISSSSFVTLLISMVEEDNWDLIKESVMLFQDNRPGVLSRIIALLENVDFLPQMNSFQAEHHIVHNMEELSDFINVDNLPQSLGGEVNYDHAKWVQQRLEVESYVLLCERLQHNFASHTVTMTTATLPTTLQATSETLNRHRSTMTSLLDDPRVRDLHDTGHQFLTQLNRVEKAENQSYSDQIQSSYESVCSAIQRYVQAADERLLSLEKHLLVKQFEESCDRILSWASDRRDELQQKFGEVADSLNELRVQRQEFDLFYLEVVKQYAQCDCLLSEANQLSSSGFLGQVNSQARNAAEKISQVVQDMEMKKEEVETASQLYLFVDQAYSWALAGMKFVTSLSMGEKMSTEELQGQIDKYDDYMRNHPPIPKDEFVKMQEVAARYNNIKCQRQCEVAQQKCSETKDLFVKRRKLLIKARDHQLLELRRQEGKMSPDPEKDSKMAAETEENGNSIDSIPTKTDKPTRAILRHNSDVSQLRIARHNGSHNNSNNGGIPSMNGPIETAATAAVTMTSISSKHRPKKMLKKSASMSGQHMRLKIGSPMRGEEPDTHGRTKWSLAVEELITTEQEYVKSLNYIIEHYYPLMNQLDDVPQALRGKRGVIFGNIENICDFHAGQFLEALEKCHEQPGRVAEVFIQHRESFGMYALYSKNKPRSDELMREHGTRFFRAKQQSLRDKMDLASYLLKPVQRMGKYALLLHNIAKHSEIQYRSLLKEAESLVKFQLRHGNDLLAMDSIVDCDVNLKEQGELKRQDEFLVFHGRRKYLRHVFLFDDLVLLSKPQKVHGGHDVYHYKSSHKTSEIGLTENIGDTGLKFEIWFRRPMQDSIVFNSSNEHKKQAWVDDIRSILWKQALKNKAHRRDEMANMGVGSKPHLDIRSSESPITDRSVATERLLGNRVLTSRSRASIAVATFEHACKRPHSTVSTSSTSSNGSFQFPHQPASIFDFRAIVEGEEYESGSGHGSSICMSNGESDPIENAEVPEVAGDASLPQQYVTTV